jgi:hypothetical protein
MKWALAIKFARALLADSRYYNRDGYLKRKDIERDFSNATKCSYQHAAWVISYLAPPLTDVMGRVTMNEETAFKLANNFLTAKETWRQR